MSETSYRNRRGHKVSISEAISDIAAQDGQLKSESQKPKPSKTTPKAKKAKSTKDKRRLKLVNWRSKYWLVPLVILALLIGGVVVVADGAKRDYERLASTMRRDITHVAKSTSSSQKTGSEVAHQLNQALDSPTDCRLSSLDVTAWYGPARTARLECQTVASDYQELKSNLSAIEDEASYAEQVSKIIHDPLKNPVDGVFASLGEYEERWSTAVSKLGKLAAPSDLKNAHQGLLAKTKDVAKYWQTLAYANADQDKAVFTATEKALSKSYLELRKAQAEIIKPLNDRQMTVNQLVDKLIIKSI